MPRKPQTQLECFEKICCKYNFDFSLIYVRDKYLNKHWSLPKFRSEHGLHYSETLFLLEFHGIQKRTLQQATSLSETIHARQKTCIERYGEDNPSKVEFVKQKKNDTFRKHYGVDNIWKDPNYYVWLHKYMLDVYGKKSTPNAYGRMQDWWDAQTEEKKKAHMVPANKGWKRFWDNASDEQKSTIIQKRFRNFVFKYQSSLETRLSSSFIRLGIPFRWQYWISRKSYDFKIHNTNLIIEVNGDFWHANPAIYKASDILRHPIPLSSKDIWQRDKAKYDLAISYDFEVVYLWEMQINKMNNQLLDEWSVRLLETYDESKKNKNNTSHRDSFRESRYFSCKEL